MTDGRWMHTPIRHRWPTTWHFVPSGHDETLCGSYNDRALRGGLHTSLETLRKALRPEDGTICRTCGRWMESEQ